MADSNADDADMPLPDIPDSDEEELELPPVMGDTSEEEVEQDEEDSSEDMFGTSKSQGKEVYMDFEAARKKALENQAANTPLTRGPCDPKRKPESTHPPNFNQTFSTTMFGPSTSNDPYGSAGRRISLRPQGLGGFLYKEPTYDIAYMTSNPLVWTEWKNGNRTRKPLRTLLNIDEEKSQLIDCCKKSIDGKRRTLKFVHRIATNGNLTQLMVQRTKVLHYSGHGIKGKLAFENEAETGSLGESNLIDKDLLKNLFQKGDVKFVFVSACHSENVGNMFVEAGVPHVISIKSAEQVDDQAANVFTKFFYMALLAGRTIKRAHELGQMNVRTMPGQAAFDAEKFLLLPASGEDYHDVTLFEAKEQEDYEGFCDLTDKVAKNKLEVNQERFYGRGVFVSQLVQTVMKQRVTIVVGDKGYGKSAVIKAASNYLLERYLFTGGMYYFEFRPEDDDPASYMLDEYFAENLCDYGAIDPSKGVSREVQTWIRRQLNGGATSVFSGMLLCLDNLEFLLLETDKFPFITAEVRRKNMRFLREILSKSRGLRILTSALDNELSCLLFSKIDATPVTRQIQKLEPVDAYEFFVKSSGMGTFSACRKEVLDVMNKLECVPQRIRDFILEVKKFKGNMDRDAAKILKQVYLVFVAEHPELALCKDQHGDRFWLDFMNDAEVANVDDILNNLDRFIKELLENEERGLFWKERSHQDGKANNATRTELHLWFNGLEQVSKQQFCMLWNARLHSLIPTITHLDYLWTTRGAVMGFWDKQRCTKIIDKASLQTFLIRFPRTFAHHVSIVLKNDTGVVHLLVAIRSNNKTLPIANQNRYYHTDLPRLQKFVKRTADLNNLWDCHSEKECPKSTYFDGHPSAKKPSTPLYTCCPDPQPGTSPKSNAVDIKRPPKPRLRAHNSSYHHSRHGRGY